MKTPPDNPENPVELAPLPVFDGGTPLLDIADRDALYDAMDDMSLYLVERSPSAPND